MMKKYISPGAWFSFEYPHTWHEFEDEAGSFLFYNPDRWTGNFRISASMDASPRYAETVMAEELGQYADARRMDIGGLPFVHSCETFQEEGVWYTSHFWVTGRRNMVVYCTFTLPKDGDKEEALSVLRTLQLMNPGQSRCHEVIPLRLMETAVINDAYERIQKEVKDVLKKDFSSATVSSSLAHLQQMMDSGRLKDQQVVWERLGRVLGCFLTEEMDGVEWVTVIDGPHEYPALLFGQEKGEAFASWTLKELGARLVDPVEFLKGHSDAQHKCRLTDVYEELVKWQY